VQRNRFSLDLPRVAGGLLLLGLLLFPAVARSEYALYLYVMSCVYVILAVGLNFTLGLTGMLSIAQPAFWGIGAYTSALLATKLGIPFWGGLVAAALLSILAGLAVGAPTTKVSGIYLTMVTITFNEVTRLVLSNWRELTWGRDGITNIPRPSIGSFTFASEASYAYLILVFTILAIIAAQRVRNSRIGRAFRAIKVSEVAANAMGVNVPLYKVLSFVLSAFYGGVAGALYAHYVGYINPDIFNFPEAVKMVSMVMIGGSGSVVGVSIGAVLLFVLPEWLRVLKEYYLAVYGLGVIVMMIYLPGGLISLFTEKLPHLVRRFTRSRPAVPDPKAQPPVAERG
jgi:branched-chain amino acid transport system permease protein